MSRYRLMFFFTLFFYCFSMFILAQTSDTVQLETPDNMVVPTPGRGELSWSPFNSQGQNIYYECQYDSDPAFKSANTIRTDYNFYWLEIDSTYTVESPLYWRVRAVLDGGPIPWSETRRLTTIDNKLFTNYGTSSWDLSITGISAHYTETV